MVDGICRNEDTAIFQVLEDPPCAEVSRIEGGRKPLGAVKDFAVVVDDLHLQPLEIGLGREGDSMRVHPIKEVLSHLCCSRLNVSNGIAKDKILISWVLLLN